MQDPWLVIAAVMALAAIYVMLPVFLYVFSRYRKGKNVRCEELNQDGCIYINASKAALYSLIGESKLQIKQCSLWNGTKDCKQECLDQI